MGFRQFPLPHKIRTKAMLDEGTPANHIVSSLYIIL